MKNKADKCIHQLFILACFVAVLFIVFFTSACKKKPDKPLDLGYFTQISAPSISHDGNQLLFNGCGHKEYPQCTIYRFERSTGKLYRYIHKNQAESIRDGRYSIGSLRFTLMTVPIYSKNIQQYSRIQIAIVNQDGTGFQQVTQGNGVKVAPLLSPDEKAVVFFKGQEREKGKRTAATSFDLYRVDLLTGKEAPLTQLEFYGVSAPYFTADGKHVVFAGDSPLRLPTTTRVEDVKKFRGDYWHQYRKHIILKYSLDGSDIDREPVPVFTFADDFNVPAERENEKHPTSVGLDHPGSDMPMLTRDGSIWFQGYTGSVGWIHYYRRLPSGEMEEITYDQLYIGGKTNRFLLAMTITPDGRWLITLNEDRDKGDSRSIRIIDTKTKEYSELTLPGSVENIYIQ